MRYSVKLMFVLVLMCMMGTMGCAGLMFPRVDLKDLPEAQYEITRYTSPSKSVAIILDDPNDDVILAVDIDKFRAKKEGLSTPQRCVKMFPGTPEAYRFQDKETGDVLGYLLISPYLKWVVHYNRGKARVGFWIDDPLAVNGK